MHEIDSIQSLEHWLEQETSLQGIALQALDLQEYETILEAIDLKETLFLGCRLTPSFASHALKQGALILPETPGFAFQSHRAQLYTAEELFEGFDINLINGYHTTLDYRIYKEYLGSGKDYPDSILVSLMRRLHDHSITDSLWEAIENRKIVAVMGGHGMERSDSYYRHIATIARELTLRGFTIVTGGGPGAMEAAHLGAYFAVRSEQDLETAIEMISKRPPNSPRGKEYADPDWLKRALNVLEHFPLTHRDREACMSIGIPTWLYGHEPPAAFATHIAKYFANSVREEGLLSIARHGVIFSPGSAGTIQEIFQDACQNHYAPYHSGPGLRHVSPMILFGHDYWSDTKPVWPLLNDVSRNQRYGELCRLTDDESEIIELIASYDPDAYGYPCSS